MSSTPVQQVLELLPEPLVVVSIEGVMLSANRSFREMVGMGGGPGGEIPFAQFALTPEDDLKELLNRCSRVRQFTIGALSLRTQSGQVLHLRCEGANLADSGFPAAAVLLRFKPREAAVTQFTLLNKKVDSLVREIVERRKAETALRQSEQRFRQLADAMPQIIWTARPDGYIDYYNRRWYEFTGFPEQFGEESWTPILHPDDLQRTLDAYFACIREECPYEIEYRFKDRLTGHYRWFLGRALPIRDESGQVARWFGTCTDIDDRKRAEEKLEEAVAERTLELREANTQLESLVYSIAHDLRAPLRSMQSFSTILLDDYASRMDETAQWYARRIVTAAELMDSLILDLLAYGCVARAELELSPVSVQSVWESAVSQNEAGIRSTGACIQAKPPLPQVRAHEPTLRQALANLLNNALKFVAPGVTPEVRFWAEKRGSAIRFWMQDNGIGIAPDHQERVFNIFERLHPKEHAGTGIGLSIVRTGIERMGGAVGLETAPGGGCLFWIELPAA